jgi:hypothetical protein
VFTARVEPDPAVLLRQGRARMFLIQSAQPNTRPELEIMAAGEAIAGLSLTEIGSGLLRDPAVRKPGSMPLAKHAGAYSCPCVRYFTL